MTPGCGFSSTSVLSPSPISSEEVPSEGAPIRQWYSKGSNPLPEPLRGVVDLPQGPRTSHLREARKEDLAAAVEALSRMAMAIVCINLTTDILDFHRY